MRNYIAPFSNADERGRRLKQIFRQCLLRRTYATVVEDVSIGAVIPDMKTVAVLLKASQKNRRRSSNTMSSMRKVYPLTAEWSIAFFCVYCEDFVFEFADTNARRIHFEAHLQDALIMAETHGYNGVSVAGRDMVPRFCVWCLHNASLSAPARLVTENSMSQPLKWFRDRSSKHLTEANFPLLCPASAASGMDFVLCGYDQKMTVDEFNGHLLEVHTIDVMDVNLRQSKGAGLRLKKRALAVKDGNAEVTSPSLQAPLSSKRIRGYCKKSDLSSEYIPSPDLKNHEE